MVSSRSRIFGREPRYAAGPRRCLLIENLISVASLSFQLERVGISFAMSDVNVNSRV